MAHHAVITSLPPSTEPPGRGHSGSGQKSAALPLRCKSPPPLSSQPAVYSRQVDGAPDIPRGFGIVLPAERAHQPIPDGKMSRIIAPRIAMVLIVVRNAD